MTQLRLFFIILILNTLVVLLYILLNILLFKRKNRSFVLCSIVMLLCPVVGPCFFVLALILFRLFYYDPVDLEDVVFSKARARTFIHAEEERESNLAPLEEAIEITEAGELRTLMMSVVRGDIQNSLATYSCFLKLYFSSGQREKFFATIDDLKRSSVVIDRETLELIRVFQ